MNSFIKIFLELTKFSITFFVTVTTLLGFVAFKGNITMEALPVTIGILLLAMGSAAMNHIQERYTDGLMDRTKNRPLPSGKISLINASLIMIGLVLSGSLVILFGSGSLALLLSLLNLIWYNLIYTPLKKKNALAIIPGSLVGAIPPAVGWVAAGGSILDPQIILLSFFFFIWQIPHFWLLVLGLDKDYRKAGFPTLTTTFSHDQLSRITFMWITATVITSFMIPFFGIMNYLSISLILVLSGIWLIYNSTKMLRHQESNYSFRITFREINYFVLIVIILISIDKIIFIN